MIVRFIFSFLIQIWVPSYLFFSCCRAWWPWTSSNSFTQLLFRRFRIQINLRHQALTRIIHTNFFLLNCFAFLCFTINKTLSIRVYPLMCRFLNRCLHHLTHLLFLIHLIHPLSYLNFTLFLQVRFFKLFIISLIWRLTSFTLNHRYLQGFLYF